MSVENDEEMRVTGDLLELGIEKVKETFHHFNVGPMIQVL